VLSPGFFLPSCQGCKYPEEDPGDRRKPRHLDHRGLAGGVCFAGLTHPYWTFKEPKYDVEIVSPKGSDLVANGFSDPEDASGLPVADILSLGFKTPEKLALTLKGISSIADVDPMSALRCRPPVVAYLPANSR